MLLKLIAASTLVMFPTLARADANRTASIEMSNGVTVGSSECLVSGKRSEAFNKGGHKLLRKIVHEGSNRIETHTVEVPAEFVGVRYQCRALTKADGTAITQKSAFTEQVISRQPLRGQGGRAGCASAASDARCTVSVVGR